MTTMTLHTRTGIAPPAACWGRHLLFEEVMEDRPVRGKRQQADYDDAVRQAKFLCRSCLIRQTCLRRALKIPMPGVWGGTTEEERDKIRSREALKESP